MAPKKGTPGYELWITTPEYVLWRKRLSMVHKGKMHSEETKGKISAANKGEQHPMYGKHHSAATRAKLRAANTGERNPNYGKHHSVETLIKMRAAQMGNRNHNYGKQSHNHGKHPSIETLAKMSAAHKGKYHSVETKQKISVATSGPNNPRWRGGISFAPYPVGWNNSLREAIRKRDNYTCVLCEESQNGRRHPVHHIDYDKQNLCSENLVTLCTICHCKTNDNRDYWQNLFKTIYVPNFPKIRRKNESCC